MSAATESVVEPSIELAASLAVIAVAPAARAVARPSLPGALLTEATAGSELDQRTASVRSCCEPSL